MQARLAPFVTCCIAILQQRSSRLVGTQSLLVLTPGVSVVAVSPPAMSAEPHAFLPQHYESLPSYKSLRNTTRGFLQLAAVLDQLRFEGKLDEAALAQGIVSVKTDGDSGTNSGLASGLDYSDSDSDDDVVLELGSDDEYEAVPQNGSQQSHGRGRRNAGSRRSSSQKRRRR